MGFLRVLTAQCWSESTFPLEFVSGSARKAAESPGSDTDFIECDSAGLASHLLTALRS